MYMGVFHLVIQVNTNIVLSSIRNKDRTIFVSTRSANGKHPMNATNVMRLDPWVR